MTSSDDRENLQAKATDLVKKVLTVGVGAVFLTEEGLRNMVSEFKLPKELLTGLLESAQKTKSEFMNKLATDVVEKLKSQIDVDRLVKELLAENDVELNVKVRFSKRGQKSLET